MANPFLTSVLLAPLLAVHLVLVNLAMAGPLVSIALRRRATRQHDELAGRVGRSMAKLALGSLAAGAVLGGVLLALMWAAGEQRYFAALAAIEPSRFFFAAIELLFYAGCMAAVAMRWDHRPRSGLLLGALSLLAATDLMFHFPPLFTVIATVARRTELHGTTVDRATYYRLLTDGEVLARIVHVWLASTAVSGLATSLLARRRAPAAAAEPTVDERARLVSWGARVSLIATLLQLPTGLWLLMTLPPVDVARLMGGDPWASALFAASILGVVYLIQNLAAIALGDVAREHTRRATVTMGAVILLMVLVLELLEAGPAL